MNGLPTDLSPGGLMTLRFTAQSVENFSSIYHSSHRLSTLRRTFPSLKVYLAFAADSLSGQILITSFDLLSEQVAAKKAFVLCRVSMTAQGNAESFIEVAELRRSELGWRFLHCARLPLSVLTDDPSVLDLKQLSSHPEAVIY